MKEAMISARRWNTDDWHMIFIGNPVMNNLARRLIWELLYEAGRSLAVPKADGIWTDGHGGAAPAGWRDVRLINPNYISEAELASWKRVVSGWEVPQPFEQVPGSGGSS